MVRQTDSDIKYVIKKFIPFKHSKKLLIKTDTKIKAFPSD